MVVVNKAKLISRLLLGIFLVIPFLLREISEGLEPYPAVLQPVGANKVSTTDNVLVFTEAQLIAIKIDGSVHEVDTEAFTGQIPHYYWGNMAYLGFGLGPARSQSLSLGMWNLTFTETKSSSLEERQAALRWIHTRLENQGLKDVNKLSARRMEVSYDKGSGAEVKRELVEEIDVDIN